MEVKIVLTGPGGELERIILKDINGECDARISKTVSGLAGNMLAVGDTITITEVE